MYIARFRCHTRHRYTNAGYEQSLRIHAVWRAREKRHPILIRRNAKFARIFRIDHPDMVHLIGKSPTHHIQIEIIAFTHLINTREHQRFHQAAMTSDHAMRTGTADRQARAIQMTCTLHEGLLIGTVIDRQVNRQLQNADRSHHSVPSVQQALIFRIFRDFGICFTATGPDAPATVANGSVASPRIGWPEDARCRLYASAAFSASSARGYGHPATRSSNALFADAKR